MRRRNATKLLQHKAKSRSTSGSGDYVTNDPLPYSNPSQHHQMSYTAEWTDITNFVTDHPRDPALKVCFLPYSPSFQVLLLIIYTSQNFVLNLKDFLFASVTGHSPTENFTHAERDSIRLDRNRIYKHQVLRVNYTTYDMRRSQDSVNPDSSHMDIMVHAPPDDATNAGHPFYYARILGVYHASVSCTLPASDSSVNIPANKPQDVEFLWVRWFALDTSAPGGFQSRRLHRLSFVDHKDGTAFGFISPRDVIRGVHIMGAPAHGTTKDLLPPSIARKVTKNRQQKKNSLKENEDYRYYYVGM